MVPVADPIEESGRHDLLVQGVTPVLEALVRGQNGDGFLLHSRPAFPQVFSRSQPGFCVVVGNPRWEEVTTEELSFYEFYRPGVNCVPDTERSRSIRPVRRAWRPRGRQT